MGNASGLRSVLDRIVSVFTGVLGGGTRDEIKPLNVSIDVADVDPAGNGPIPVEVRFQSNPSYLSPSEDVVVGLDSAFESAGRDAVTIAHPDLVATPETVRDLETPHEGVADFENPHEHGKLMHVSPSDLVLPLEPGMVTFGVGAFPEGPAGPSEHWATDTVGLSVDEPGEMRVRLRQGSREGRRSVEVYHPEPFDPSDVRLGSALAFDQVSDEQGSGMRVAEGAADDLVRPAGSVAVAGHENHWLLEFPDGAIDDPVSEAWDGELVVGIFPNGEEEGIPAEDWASTRVADGPDHDVTG